MRDSSQTSCSATNTVRGRIETERSDEPQAAGHRLGANAASNHPSKGAQGPLRAALAASLERTPSVLETRSAEELHLPWQDKRRTALGCDDPANLQDGSRTSSYQEAGYATYPEAFFRDGTTRLCQQLKPPPLAPVKEVNEPPQAEDVPLTTDEIRCPTCLSCKQRDGREQPMVLTGSTFRPSWRNLFYGPDHPQWFES